MNAHPNRHANSMSAAQSIPEGEGATAAEKASRPAIDDRYAARYGGTAAMVSVGGEPVPPRRHPGPGCQRLDT
jgi:hypothetical protein